MIEITLTINNQVGLHARPAATLVQTSRQFKSSVRILYNGRDVDAKSILGVLSLGVNKGNSVLAHISGEDENDAAQALETLVAGNFGEAE